MKTVEEIILEIERRINTSDKIIKKVRKETYIEPTGQFWFHRHSLSLYKELLSWIKSNDEKRGVR